MVDEHHDRILTCVYCGHAYPPGTPAHGADVLTALHAPITSHSGEHK